MTNTDENRKLALAGSVPQTLRLFDPSDEPEESLPESSGSLMLPVDRRPDPQQVRGLIEQLQNLLPAAGSGDPRQAPPEGYRLREPVNQAEGMVTGGAILTLRGCLESDQLRNPHRRANWGQYETLLKHWEEAWGGVGPDMRSLTTVQLNTAFGAVEAWRERETWARNFERMVALMKSMCRQTRANKYGIAKPEPALLNEEDFPIWELPPEAWFASRPAPAKRHAGHRRSTLPLMTIDELDLVMKSAGQMDDPLWWKTVIGWFWFCGMRSSQTLLELPWRNSLAEEGVDLSNRCLHSRESKCNGALDVPIPTWLIAPLEALKYRQTRQVELFEDDPGERLVVFHKRKKRGDQKTNRKSKPKRFYSDWESIWTRAGVPVREPHQMRGVSISWWLKCAEKYRKQVTGHSTAGDMQMSRYVTFDDDFRKAAEAHPRPTLPLV